MSTHTSAWPAGTPCWADLGVDDVDAACAFYRTVLSWDFPPPDPRDGGYRIASVRGHAVAAVGPRPSPQTPVAWLLHFASEDADSTARAITDSGGTVLLEPGDVGSHGRLSVASDPTGAVFGIWQAGEHIGAALVNEPGGITWEDLRSSSPERAQEFYVRVFGFVLQPVEMAPQDYRTFHRGSGAPLGGMGGFMGPPGSSHWAIYYSVVNTDEAVAAAVRAGGAAAMPVTDTPFGRLAGITDPEGAFFHVVQSPDR